MTNADTDAKWPEARSSDLLRTTNAAILWEADASAVHFSFVSESASAVLGFAPQEWKAEPAFLQKRVHPDDWSRLLQTLYDAAQDRTLHKCEHRMLRADGSTLWAQTSVRQNETASGSTLLTGMTVDVTHLKEVEDRIRREESTWRLLVDNLRGSALFLLSADGAVRRWSHEAKRATGYGPEQIVGQDIGRLFPPGERDARTLDRLLRRAEQLDCATFEGWLIRQDGSRLWASVVVTAAFDELGRLAGYSAVLSDLTERHQVEVDLRRTAEDLRLLTRNVHEDGIWMTSRAGLVECWQPSAQRLFGYRPHEVVDTPVAALLPPGELTSSGLERLFETAARTGSSTYEGWLVRKNGERFWGRVIFGAAEDDAQRLRGYATVARDITEAKRREDALRASEEHFRLLVDSVQDFAIYMLSVDGRVASWNPGAQRLHGYRSHEIVGQNASLFFPLDEIAKGAPARCLEKAAAEGHASYEGWLVRKSGDRFWGILHLDAIEDEEGRLRGFSKVARDLSAQRRADAALRESEQRLRLLIDSLQDYAVFMVSPEGTVASWNRGAERVCGYRGDEVMGAPLSRFFPPEEVALGKLDRLVERARADGDRVEYEGTLVGKDGRTFWGSIMLNAVRDSDRQLRGFSIIARDLTERMRNERAQTFLAEAGQGLAGSLDYRTTLEKVARLAIRELADCCIVAIDIAGAITPVALAHVDAERQRELECALAELPSNAPILRGFAQTMRTREGQFHPDAYEADWVRDQDTATPSVFHRLGVRSCMCAPMVVRGRAFGVMCFMSTTPSRRYDATDLSLAEELARRAALAVENARLYEEAQHAIRTREEVLAIVSHDLRGPLSTILLGVKQFLKKGAAPTAPVTPTLERIARSAERMNQMIRDLLDFSSIEAGRLTLEQRDVALRDLVRDVVESYTPIAAEKGLHLVDATATADARLRCDPNRIVQVLSNLVGNAIKFTPSGKSVTLEAELAEGGRTVMFKVIDTGPGIAGEDVPHVFDRYWQGKQRSGQGVGLGLAISKGLVEAHGGTIRLATRPGEGCTFSFTLPAMAQGD